MTIKYFCDKCDVEVSEPQYSLEMTGKILCSKHLSEYIESNKTQWNIYKLPHKYRKLTPWNIKEKRKYAKS